jgi:hypothetical protein
MLQLEEFGSVPQAPEQVPAVPVLEVFAVEPAPRKHHALDIYSYTT